MSPPERTAGTRAGSPFTLIHHRNPLTTVSPSEKLQDILAQLQRPGGTPTADLIKVLEQLSPLLESLQSGHLSLYALKKAGAWKDKPLREKKDQLTWVKLPCEIDFGNITPSQLENLRASPLNATDSVVRVGGSSTPILFGPTPNPSN